MTDMQLLMVRAAPRRFSRCWTQHQVQSMFPEVSVRLPNPAATRQDTLERHAESLNDHRRVCNCFQTSNFNMLTPCATVGGRCNGHDAQSGGGKRKGRENDVLLSAHLSPATLGRWVEQQKSGRAFTVRAYLELRFVYRTRA